MNYGLQLVPRETGGWELGGAGIPRYVTEILEPEGNWEGYLPTPERQRKGVETMACTVFATLNVCEMLIKRKYNLDVNFSDRWLAWASGIKPVGANPHDIAETLRKAGVPKQEYWDFTDDLKTWEEFYTVPPTKLYALARAFLDSWSFKHYYVPQEGIKDALKFSPLGISVFAWAEESGVYQQYGRDNHWTVCYNNIFKTLICYY